MDLEGILAIIFIFGGGTAFLLAISPVGRAIADRIRQGAVGSPDWLRRVQETQEALLSEVESLRQAVSELEERMDFAERLLTRQREAGRLSAGEVSGQRGGAVGGV